MLSVGQYRQGHSQGSLLTVHVQCGKSDAMESGHCREDERGSEAGVAEPFRLSSKDTGGHEDVVPAAFYQGVSQ